MSELPPGYTAEPDYEHTTAESPAWCVDAVEDSFASEAEARAAAWVHFNSHPAIAERDDCEGQRFVLRAELAEMAQALDILLWFGSPTNAGWGGQAYLPETADAAPATRKEAYQDACDVVRRYRDRRVRP